MALPGAMFALSFSVRSCPRGTLFIMPSRTDVLRAPSFPMTFHEVR
jgi:hypothetical protein